MIATLGRSRGACIVVVLAVIAVVVIPVAAGREQDQSYSALASALSSCIAVIGPLLSGLACIRSVRDASSSVRRLQVTSSRGPTGATAAYLMVLLAAWSVAMLVSGGLAALLIGRDAGPMDWPMVFASPFLALACLAFGWTLGLVAAMSGGRLAAALAPAVAVVLPFGGVLWSSTTFTGDSLLSRVLGAIWPSSSPAGAVAAAPVGAIQAMLFAGIAIAMVIVAVRPRLVVVGLGLVASFGLIAVALVLTGRTASPSFVPVSSEAYASCQTAGPVGVCLWEPANAEEMAGFASKARVAYDGLDESVPLLFAGAGIRTNEPARYEIVQIPKDPDALAFSIAAAPWNIRGCDLNDLIVGDSAQSLALTLLFLRSGGADTAGLPRVDDAVAAMDLSAVAQADLIDEALAGAETC